jgi:hypothetical protein
VAVDRTLNVYIAAQVTGGPVHEKTTSVPIPPDYDAADVRALMVRRIEDSAFDLVREDFGREPTRTALRAAVARLIGIEAALDETVDDVTTLRVRLRTLIELSNAEAIEQYGEPQGE